MPKRTRDTFQGPKSICICGHTGDGENSHHDDEKYTFGSGKCSVTNCTCSRFTWREFTKKFENYARK